ncbi:hypothetical protein QJS04_geneDACA013051 [Acorus gramineus]|uniref:SHSP domain-containing protein n=1 Tax=Acorus gramineus TaxID=55184 RepID=A0AAV9B1C8_ACOGR|nr:hypothetical protein QJS04_geneDACA013051 [Acorus gramineus]
MKVHPVPKKRNITVRFGNVTTSGDPLSSPSAAAAAAKKLRRLPHIFARVLELPFRADADVAVHDSPGFLRFVAATDDDLGPGVRARPVEVHPGVTKVYIEAPGLLGIPALSELELDVWRFRLPASTRPDLASAEYGDGELIVTVPKGVVAEEEEEVWGEGFGRLVIVQ